MNIYANRDTVYPITVYPITVKLVVWECPSCGIVYGTPEQFANQSRDNGRTYYCPNDHQEETDG